PPLQHRQRLMRRHVVVRLPSIDGKADTPLRPRQWSAQFFEAQVTAEYPLVVEQRILSVQPIQRLSQAGRPSREAYVERADPEPEPVSQAGLEFRCTQAVHAPGRRGRLPCLRHGDTRTTRPSSSKRTSKPKTYR